MFFRTTPNACLAASLVLAAALPAPAADTLHHRLQVTLHPAEHRLEAVDTVTLTTPPSGGAVRFTLHGGLSPSAADPGVSLKRESAETEGTGAETWLAVLPPGSASFTLRYGGVIDHPLEQVGEEYARGQKETWGSISSEGVFLTGNSGWYPVLEGRAAATFSLEVSLPAGWEAVSQGERSLQEAGDAGTRVRWEATDPQDEIYLVAGTWTEYRRDAGGVEAMVFLRSPDEALAGKYLEATERYLGMYSKLIGPYPWRKWAVVENFWETGYGMPSFTLLGPQVIRFPFILTSSYPHEILHAWWGNGVWIDYDSGNWGEGLTAYLADHLIKEQQGSGAEHRQNALQKYADYVLEGRDFPLTEFRSRHGSVTETVGYGKSMMLFHMLRRELGDGPFVAGLRKLYRDFRGRTASFDDLRRSFEESAERDLGPFFDQWVGRPGAPSLALLRAEPREGTGGWTLSLTIAQAQEEAPWAITVPVAVTLEGGGLVRDEVPVPGRETKVTLTLPAPPVRVDVDPEFDLFRRLDRREIPVALSSAFGAKKAVVVLPSGAPPPLLEGYRLLAAALEGTGPGEVRTVADADLDGLPPDTSVWLLGWENTLLPAVRASLEKVGATFDPDGVTFGLTRVPKAGHSVTMVARHPGNPDLAVLFVAGDDPAAFPGLGRKLPHYHKYSYLGFEGTEPANVAKGRWEVTDSPLTAFFGSPEGRPAIGALPARKPLAELPPAFSRERMLASVRRLASEEMEGRGFGTAGADRAADWLAAEFAAAGLQPAGEKGTFFQSWTERGGEPEREVTLRNVLGVIPGKNPGLEGSVVVGAHYDGLGRGWPDVRAGNEGMLHPGADDDASGLAVLLELARALAAGPPPDRPILFAAFAAEEAGRRGSRRCTADTSLPHPANRAIGMIQVDTVGRLGKGRLLVLGASSAREWVHIFRGAGFVAGVELETPSQDLDASDQVSFHECGVPAVQLTTGPHADYHRPSDIPGKIDGDGLVKVAAVAREAVEYLAGRREPLTSANAPPPPSRGRDGVGGSERKVSLGTVPDFAFAGPGVRLTGTLPGSPAERAGLLEGDVILRVNDTSVSGMKDFSEALKKLKPGEGARVTFTRGGEERTVEAAVEAR